MTCVSWYHACIPSFLYTIAHAFPSTLTLATTLWYSEASTRSFLAWNISRVCTRSTFF